MILDLNAVTITQEVYNKWMETVEKGVAILKKQYPDLSPSEIPDEQVGFFEDGTFIFVDVRETRIRMELPKGHFQILN